MPYFVLRFVKPGKSHKLAPATQHMIEAGSAAIAKDRADQLAYSGGGRHATLQLFNEIGLVSSRTAQGVWSR